MADVDRTSAVVQFACIALCTFWTVLIGVWVANAVHHRKVRGGARTARANAQGGH